MSRDFKNRVGEKFGKLTIIAFSHKEKKGRQNYISWLCRCECGNKKVSRINNLIGGGVKSCGCIKKTTQGLYGSKFHMTWRNMKSRCSDKNNPSYIRYGGRGIRVCKRWMKFQNFKKDMYESFLIHNKKHGGRNTSIERIDNNGNYELSNCKWATIAEQHKNKRQSMLPIREVQLRRLVIIFSKRIKKLKKQKRIDSTQINPKINREENIWLMRQKGLTLQEIGDKFSITRERVRQILSKLPINTPIPK